jgi:hypothetical protein
MPEINGVLTRQSLTTVVNQNEAELNVDINTENPILRGVITPNEESISAVVTSNEDVLSADLIDKSETHEARLDVHYGVDGKPGKDGVSPTIVVEKDTDTEYILKVTDIKGSFLTPNLKPTINEKENWDKKVDEDLLEYPLINPTTLTTAQREGTFLYAREQHVDKNSKISLSVVALKPEVDEQIKNKLQTVKKRPVD